MKNRAQNIFSKYTLLLFSVFLLNSCDFKENKLQGKWKLWQKDDSNPFDNIEQEYKFKPTFVDFGIVCNKDTFLFEHINDTILNFKGNIYANEKYCFRYDTNRLQIDLPNIEYPENLKYPYESYDHMLLFGKRKDNGEYAFLFNDVYGTFEDLDCWFERENWGPEEPNYIIAIDKNTKMSMVQSIFDTINKLKTRKPWFFVSQSNDYSHRIGYRHKIRPFTEFEDRQNHPNSTYESWGPIFDFSHFLFNKHKESTVILDSNGNVSIDSKRVNNSEIQPIISQMLNKDSALFVILLFDKNVSYEKWLSVNSCIKKAFMIIWDKKSKELFNKEIGELTEEELYGLKKKYLIRMTDFEIDTFKKLTQVYNK
jgi:hypothetical protein